MDFILPYAILGSAFIAFFGALFFLSGRVFEASKTEDVKEGTKLAIRIMSIFMCLFIYLLDIPMMSLIL